MIMTEKIKKGGNDSLAACNAALPAKFKVAAEGSQNGRRDLERG